MDLFYLGLAFLLVLLNGFFVATEFAIVKVRPTRLEELQKKGRHGVGHVKNVVGKIDAYLAATQLGITLASLGLGWLGKPAFAALLERPMQAVGLGDPELLRQAAATAAFATISILHIVVGELMPKSLAILRAENVALACALPMRFFFIVLYPAIWVLNGFANGMLKLLGLGAADHTHSHSEEEIRIILSQARSAGLLSSDRVDLLQKALSLPARTAKHLMVPRSEVVVLDVTLALDENLERAAVSEHTRFPLCDRELDDVLGIVDIRDVLFHMQRHEGTPDLRSFARPAFYVPEVMSGDRLLAEFRARRAGMAIVVDEYGGASGTVTPADVVSAVMGELEQAGESELVALPGGAYDVEGATPIDEVVEALKTPLRTDDMRTVAGFLMERLGRMPRIGDRVSESGFTFNVLEVSGPRVQKVRIQRDAGVKRPATAATAAQPRPTGPQPVQPDPRLAERRNEG